MKPQNLSKLCISFFMVILILFFILHCSKEAIINDSSRGNSSKPIYPALNDSIPYDRLGSGKIVFQRKGPPPHGYSAVYALDIDQQTAWIDSNAGDQCAISPTGDVVAFSAYTNSSTLWDIYTVGLHSRNRKQRTNLEMFEKFPSWAPDGSLLFFWGSGKMNDPNAYFFKLSPSAAGTQPDLIVKFTDRDPSGRLSVSVSVNIAYVTHSFATPNENGLYIMNRDGSHHYQLLPETDSLTFEAPVFSPDGQSIYFLQVFRPMLPNQQKGAYRRFDVLKVDLQDTSVVHVAGFPARGIQEWSDGLYGLKGNGVYLALSPDGQKLLLNVPGGDYVSHLYVVNVDGSAFTQVTSADRVTDRCASWGR